MAVCSTVCQLLDIWSTKGMDHPPVLFAGELLRHALGQHHRAAGMRCQGFFRIEESMCVFHGRS